jgi:hypothetical protein
LHDKKGDELINHLEKNYYGSSNTNPLRFERRQITFKPTTARDLSRHCSKESEAVGID